MPSVVPMLPATMVPSTPTISDTRAPKIRRLSTSRLWKSVPSSQCMLPPADQTGGSKIFAPGIGSVGSYGAITLAKMAISTNGTRISKGTSGRSRPSAAQVQRPDGRPERRSRWPEDGG